MATQQQLKEANYVVHEDHIENLGQCGWEPCDHSKIFTDEKSGNEYRYCMKLQMRVDDYASCKYHSKEEWSSLIEHMANLLVEEEALKQKANAKTSKKKTSKKKWLLVLLVVCVCILLYIWFKYK